ncbi:bifunctional diguanylate cyclase/phosphodiesterase [Herbaspirillum sp. YR522]|uniref:putative bifunctional diguanylate cyclase/phosphodiesterase n=1 Tax=Herbaspirillum sp. YR522 TaxID=1144342 RepID=UPI00026F5C0C|nr:EAL domain-containing protein [Herbaspirillum sp. YR522]EJN10208.1 diguanylate cyclase (GGDEF) domain-containing protein [Herbaspirillum sp. YR522]
MNLSAIWATLRQNLSLERGKPELLRAQYKAFSRKVPMMYVILLVNTWALAFTHLDSTPRWLTIYFPTALTLICAVRFVSWWRVRSTEPDAELAWRALRRTSRLVGPIAMAFSLWAVTMFPYGDDYARAHVAFYMGITIVSCIFCLMYLRSAALTGALIVNGIFAVFFISTNIPTFIAAAINVALVTLVMLVIVSSHYNEFTLLVDSREKAAALSEENYELANLDPLTRIANRRKFFATLEGACERAVAAETRFAIAILDLDGFKSINDLYGHSHGDQLLIEVANRLRRVADERVHVARLGGDEFAVIIDSGLDDASLHDFCQHICDMLRASFLLSNSMVQVAASLGVATFPDMAGDAKTLYEHADYALYHGKRNRKGTVTLFSNADKADIQRNAIIEQALRLADFDHELSVHFQPIVDLQSNATIAFEALARWTSPRVGMVSPDVFIPAAERMGIIGQISENLMRKALRIASTWPSHIHISFNLSADDLNGVEGIDKFAKVIRQMDFDPGRLDLEITETATLYDLDKTKRVISALRDFGCGVTLDDFGTGYSSLTQLHALPLTRIKIDKSFVLDIESNPVSRKIVKSLLTLSRDMSLGCVVEGVESEAARDILVQLGATLGQGYFYSRPLAAQDVPGWLAATAHA